uniref:ODAD1 central coiled coil region domain-containing protein n=1 Tax=Echeneis naucrates TaxID=173247 RepID=A0A665VQZ3_ECHNA
MPLSGNAVKAPLHDQIMEMQRKIQLLEGDRAAHHESSQAAMKKNREAILQLRQENKRLYRKLAQANAGDEHIIKAAFHNRGLEKDVYRNMSGKMALTTLDQKALSKMKRLNALKHTTQTYEQRLEEERLTTINNLRALENSLEKTQFKCKEAENIMTNYLKLKSHMQEESLTFQSQLDSLEAEILKSREELHNLQVMNNDAQHSKEAAKAELQKQEEQLYKERKERERIIASYRKKVEERKAHAEKVDRRTQRANMQQDELSSEVQHSTTRMTGEEEKAISTFEEAFQRIKEATGVTDVQDVVQRFISQKETHLHLEKLKAENEKMIQQLKEQKELLSQQFQDVKYSGEAKLSRWMLEESEQRLQAQQQKCDVAKERLDWLVKTISTIRAGVEHLANKLQHIRLVNPIFATMTLMPVDNFGFNTLLLKISGDIQTYQFFVRIERKLPSYNTRVKLPEDQSLDLFNDEDESEEDEADILSREALKRQSQLIVDSKSKKKPWKKKKGKF